MSYQLSHFDKLPLFEEPTRGSWDVRKLWVEELTAFFGLTRGYAILYLHVLMTEARGIHPHTHSHLHIHTLTRPHAHTLGSMTLSTNNGSVPCRKSKRQWQSLDLTPRLDQHYSFNVSRKSSSHGNDHHDSQAQEGSGKPEPKQLPTNETSHPMPGVPPTPSPSATVP